MGQRIFVFSHSMIVFIISQTNEDMKKMDWS